MKMEDSVINIITSVLQIPRSEVTVETEIGEPDEWDSLHNVTIFSEIQKEFGITITPDMLIDLENVADIIKMVEELTDGNG